MGIKREEKQSRTEGEMKSWRGRDEELERERKRERELM